MAEKWGHKVLPLAPYSPELNPIEKVWANIKRYLRTVLSDYVRFDDALLSYFDFNLLYDVHIITQNVDALHEKAGSSKVLHLHGELNKLRSTVDDDEIIEFTGEQTDDIRDSQGNPMRPHIVFFGEQVPMFDAVVEEMRDADVVMIVGTSMQVYPAASLIHYALPAAERYLVDPNPQGVGADVEVIPKRAAEGVPALVEYLISRV